MTGISKKHKTGKRFFGQPINVFCLCIVFILSYLTYFHNFQNPDRFFWDENYHVPKAQMYLNDGFFMHHHPPLGKLLIALGQQIYEPDAPNDQFININHADEHPDGFSLTGYRLIPTFLAWMTAPIIFFIFFVITRSSLLSTLLSFLYIFDNALIVHLRGAMLEAPLVFFTATTILLFLLLMECKKDKKAFIIYSSLFGISFALALTTKLVGLILILMIPALLFHLYPNRKKILIFLAAFSISFLVVFVAVWHIHFSLTGTVNPELKNNGNFSASPQYQEILRTEKNTSFFAFPVMMRDSLSYVKHENKGVPSLNLCKEKENGSPFFLWPFGGRSINYRWKAAGELGYKYLYLQINPVVWTAGLLGIILAGSYLLGTVFFSVKRSPRTLLIGTFLIMYISYMLTVSQLDRVMYLYHYFLPLLFSFILFGIMIMEIRRVGKILITARHRLEGLLTLSIIIFISFIFYYPLTYYIPITNEAFQKRALIPLWNLECINCEPNTYLAEPICKNDQKKRVIPQTNSHRSSADAAKHPPAE